MLGMKANARLLVCALAAILCCGGVQAQNKKIYLASSSSRYPNERPIWNEKQAQEWFDKHSPIKGINHPEPPCDAVSQDEALQRAAQIGYNSVRWWPNSWDYIKSVDNYATIAAKHGINCAPVFGFTHVPTSASDSTSMEKKVREIIRYFRGDERIIMWDIWNEPVMSGEDCRDQMKWIRIIAQWCREEGCTQAITSSILWDPEISAAKENAYTGVRREAEKEMDLHNFHDYVMQESHSANITYVMNRFKKIDNRPLVCTECLTRPDGSGMAITLSEFSKHKIGFYTWGLYASDPNWEIKWGRSAYYAYEPMFHNILYAGGDPVNEQELECVKNFRFQEGSESIYPGKEITERWTKRRAWKWMNDTPLKGIKLNSLDEAAEWLNQHASDGVYNTMTVNLSYKQYNQTGITAYGEKLGALAAKANNAGIKLIPVFFKSGELASSKQYMAQYISNIMGKFYNDRRFEGWCLFDQTSTDEPSDYKNVFQYIFSYVRYVFPNQPMFAAPMLDASQQVDSTAADFNNYMWQLSDVVAFNTPDGAEVSSSQLENLFTAYERPLFFMNTRKLQDGFAPLHVNWVAAEQLDANEVKNFKNTPLYIVKDGDTNKMPSWKAWAMVNNEPVKGLSYSSADAALAGISAQGPKGIYNSVQVRFDFRNYSSDRAAFIEKINAVLDSAAKYGMTVLPGLLDDRYATRNATTLGNYVADVIKTYNNDSRIKAWEIYNRPSTSSQATNAKMLNLIPQLFTAARNVSPQRPVFVTPYVQTTKFAADFDYIGELVHGHRNGWNKLTHGYGSVNLTYLCWKLSDIVSYNSSQDSPELGWLNSVAYRFGRPVICSKWENKSSSTIDETLAVFNDCHVMWYVDGSLDDAKVKSFKYRTIITEY